MCNRYDGDEERLKKIKYILVVFIILLDFLLNEFVPIIQWPFNLWNGNAHLDLRCGHTYLDACTGLFI